MNHTVDTLIKEIEPSKKQEEKVFPATIVSIIGRFRVVIDRGEMHGINIGQRFLLYTLSAGVIVDASGNSLGYLELPKGTGKVMHTQEKMSIIESDMVLPSEKTIKRTRATYAPTQEEEIITVPSRLKAFDNPVVGDKAKPI